MQGLASQDMDLWAAISVGTINYQYPGQKRKQRNMENEAQVVP